ncbi:MAG: hypothetical protein C0404_09050 [Verrucomicrobia bacterium]|nr:hypothetical protein [Verrucomicrobiota bacterium]
MIVETEGMQIMKSRIVTMALVAGVGCWEPVLVAGQNIPWVSTNLNNGITVEHVAFSGSYEQLDGPARQGMVRDMWGASTDTNGNAYVFDHVSSCIRAIRKSDGRLMTLTGNGHVTFGNAGASGPAYTMRMGSEEDGIGICMNEIAAVGDPLSGAGSLYVSDADGGVIVRLYRNAAAGDEWWYERIAGLGTQSPAPGIAATNTILSIPRVATTPDGRVGFASGRNNAPFYWIENGVLVAAYNHTWVTNQIGFPFQCHGIDGQTNFVGTTGEYNAAEKFIIVVSADGTRVARIPIAYEPQWTLRPDRRRTRWFFRRTDDYSIQYVDPNGDCFLLQSNGCWTPFTSDSEKGSIGGHLAWSRGNTGMDGRYLGWTTADATPLFAASFPDESLLPRITSDLNDTAYVNSIYSYTIRALGHMPISFRVSGLPAGFCFDGTNAIAGIPLSPGRVGIQLVASNAVGVTTQILTLAVSASGAAPGAGLLAHWSFDEGSGTNIADVSGNGHAAICTANPAWTAGREGGALLFDGDDKVFPANGGDSLFTVGFTQRTVEAWVTLATNSGKRILYEEGTTTHGLALAYSASDGKFLFGTVIGGWQRTRESASVFEPDATNWIHVAAVFDSGAMRLFVNGNEEFSMATSNAMPARSSNQAGIGTSVGDVLMSNAKPWAGRIDDLRVYGSALSYADVQKQVPGIGDADDDGMPDTWETAYFGGAGIAGGDAFDDRDLDGMRNLEEYIAGTDPTNSASLLFISGVETTGGEGLTLTFDSVLGRLYTGLVSDNLASGNWTTIQPGNVIGTGGSMQVSDTNAVSPRFLRVKVRLQ